MNEAFTAAANGDDKEMQDLLERHAKTIPLSEKSSSDGSAAAIEAASDDQHITIPPSSPGGPRDLTVARNQEHDNSAALVNQGQGYSSGAGTEDEGYPKPVRMIADFLIQHPPSERPTAHEALRFLEESAWDLDGAILNYRNARFADEEAQEEPAPEEPDIFTLNPNLDRTPAVKGQVTPEKANITLKRPNGKTKTNKFPNIDNMDWNSAEDILALNRWRGQLFR